MGKFSATSAKPETNLLPYDSTTKSLELENIILKDAFILLHRHSE